MGISPLGCLSSKFCRISHFVLAFLWCLSLGFGLLLAYTNQALTVSLMYTAPKCSVSIVGLFIILLFPLLLSAAAVKFSVHAVIYPIVFTEGIAFGYFLLGSILTFGSFGWLISLMLSFSSLAFIVPKISFYFQCFSDNPNLSQKLLSCVLAAVIIGTFDYCITNPFLISIVSDR